MDKEKTRVIFQNGLKNNSTKYLIARNDINIIGFISLSIKNSLWQEGNIGHVDELVVDMTYRKKGVGSLLLAAITNLA